MTSKDIAKLLELISQAVNEDGPWHEKRDAIQAECDEDSAANVAEFATWFVAFDDDNTEERN